MNECCVCGCYVPEGRDVCTECEKIGKDDEEIIVYEKDGDNNDL